jgi:hypothetical protein
MPDAVDTVVCAPDDGWKYHPKYVKQLPDIDKLCNVASCWIYIGILLGAHPVLHISRIRVNFPSLVYTFLTLVLKICVLPWEVPIAPSGSLFQSVMVLFTKEYWGSSSFRPDAPRP